MKNIIILIIFCLMGFAASAQTPFSITKSKRIAPETAQISAGNVWYGSTLSYALTNEDDFDKSFLLHSRIMYEIPTEGKINLPIMGTVGIPITEIDFANLEIGVYPWGVLSEKDNMVIVGHAGLKYLVRPTEEASASLQTTSVLAGIELAYWPDSEGLPYTFSLSPVYDINNLDLENDFRLEITAVIPISNGLGLLVDWDINKNGILSLGVITNNLIK